MAILILVCALAAGLVNAQSLGDARVPVHEVSVNELLARAEFFDKQPVRVIGVASFHFGFEASSSLYASVDDELYGTYARVNVRSFEEELNASDKQLEEMSGKWVLIEGIFHSIPRTKFKEDDLVICPRGCPQPGYIKEINRVEVWRPTPRVES